MPVNEVDTLDIETGYLTFTAKEDSGITLDKTNDLISPVTLSIILLTAITMVLVKIRFQKKKLTK